MTKLLKLPLKYILLALATIFVCAIVIVSVFGFNTSIEYGGGYQVKVDVTDASNYQNLNDAAIKTLSKKGVCVESSFVEDNAEKTNLVLRVNTKNINAAELKQCLATELNLEASKVGEFEYIAATITSKSILMFGVAVLVIIALLFFIGWKRYHLFGGLTLGVVVLCDLLLFLSLLILTRLPLSTSSLVALIISMMFSLVVAVCVLEELKANNGTKQYEDLNEKELTIASASPVMLPALIFAGSVAAVSLLLIIISNSFIKLFALSNIVGLLVGLFVGLIVTTSLVGLLLELYNIKQKQRVSKNPDIVKIKRNTKTSK